MKLKNDFIEVHSKINGGRVLCLNTKSITMVGTYEKKGKVDTILIIDGWENGTLPVEETYTEMMKKMFGDEYGE